MSRLLWNSIQEDHDHIWEFVNFLTGGPGDPEGSEQQRRLVALRLVAVGFAHEVAEEVVIWPAVRRFAPGGEEMALDALCSERLAKRVYNEFRHVKPGTLEFEECLKALSGIMRLHTTYEQSQVWPALEGAISAEQADRLARLWRRERRRAPTWPHPHTPPGPSVLTSFGRMVAAVDRARDLVSLRDVV